MALEFPTASKTGVPLLLCREKRREEEGQAVAWGVGGGGTKGWERVSEIMNIQTIN